MRFTGITILSGVISLAILLSACGPATPSYKPVFVEQPCPMEISPEYKVRCGTVSVPEDRTQEAGKQVILSVAVVEPPRAPTGQPPVIVLTGGPGFGILEYLQYSLEPYRRIIGERPVIFFDQRGTGLSQPALDCPEILEADEKVSIQDLPDDEESQTFIDAYAACKARLVGEGVTLSAYNTAASADDVRDIVTALGFPSVYLFGTSYGTRLGQVTILRHQSEGWIAGAILDSVVPLQVNLEKESWTNTQGIFKYFFTHCAADLKCNARYPDLQETFYATLEQLKSSPLEVKTFDPRTGESLKLKMDDQDFVSILFLMLYDPFQASSLPQIIYRAHRGDTKLLADPYRQSMGMDYGAFEGMTLSVACADDAWAINMDSIRKANAALDPPFQNLAEGDAEELQKICQLWDVKPSDAKQHRVLKTKLPILILSGKQDPVTPPAWGKLLHDSIPGSYFYTFPGAAHDVFNTQPDVHVCAESIILHFMEDSSQSPDGTCISKLKPLPFRVQSQ